MAILTMISETYNSFKTLIMKRLPDDILDKYLVVNTSVRKNLHLLNVCNPENVDIESLIRFNSRIILSDCVAFLEAVKNDIGGEIIEDSTLGPFLYYGDSTN